MQDNNQWIEKYNVIWDTQSRNAAESMPVGGGDIGLNVWVEKNDVLFYVSRSDMFDENNQLLKLGRVRIRVTPNPLSENGAFRQELRVGQGYIEIEAAHGDTGPLWLKMWTEVYRPVIHIEIDSSTPVTVEAHYESWRTAARAVIDRDPCTGLYDYPGEVHTHPDQIRFQGDGVLMYHRNDNADLTFDKEVDFQRLESHKDRLWNPLRDVTFGGYMSGRDMVPGGRVAGQYHGTEYQGWVVRSRHPATDHHVRMYLHTDQTPDLDAWSRGLERLVSDVDGDNTSWAHHQAWWACFWDRSHIAIHPDHDDENNKAWQVGRNYQLFRYMLACNAYGRYPTKFNGGLFTFDPRFVDEMYGAETPDFRRWGGGTYTAQNQRLVYWPMLKSGDFDMMAAQFDFYRRALPAAELRSRVYWGHDGCSFTEQLNNFGLPCGREYGWNRRPELDPGVEDSAYVSYEYVHQLDFSLMILEYYFFSGNDIAPYLPFIESSVRFFDEHYRYRSTQLTGTPLDEHGHLTLYPSTACETFKDAKNPSDVIAGLRVVLSRMFELPETLAPSDRKEEWRRILERIPPLPYEEKSGRRTIAPAEAWSHVQNQEIPQLYPVFPFTIFGIGRLDTQVAIDTWIYSVYHENQKNYVSWHQGGIFCARLGLVDEAAEYAVKKLSDSDRRFPAFWGPGHDWVPDHNWGGSGMIGLQEMLLQTHGHTIYLLPAWPKDWDVDFKLHAPQDTVVEGTYRGRRLTVLRVSPPHRRKDIVVMNASFE